jgi:betaine-aldehyde dehydrogenase
MRELSAAHWIDGEWVQSGVKTDSFNPASGDIIGQYFKAGSDEAKRAIKVAKRVFDESDWKHNRDLRARVLNNMADVFEARSKDLVEILSLENGKIKPEAEFEVSLSGPTIRFNAALALTDMGRAAQVSEEALSMLVRQPVGVAGIIAPWNSPLALALRSLAPALAAGTTVVVNLPWQTAQTDALIAEILSQVSDLPVGVINVIIGGHESAGELVSSPDVPVISFTGSTKTGKEILASASTNLKRVGLELGGKNPMIVFDDADLDLVLPKISQALTVFAGQFCMTGSRLLVQKGVEDELTTRLADRLSKLKVGPAADPNSEMGPLIDKANVKRVDDIVEKAISEGAKVIVRGGPINKGVLAKGAFYQPTLLKVTDPDMSIVQDEVFGPVLTLMSFDGENEALSLANNSQYGLSASVFTKDHDIATRISLRLESGTVWVNDWAVLHDQFEEGGFKGSGLGRMRGLAVMDDFIEYKHISLRSKTH